MLDNLRCQIIALDSKLAPERMPTAKERLHFALHTLEHFEKTGENIFLSVATHTYTEIVRAIGDRSPETLREMPQH